MFRKTARLVCGRSQCDEMIGNRPNCKGWSRKFLCFPALFFCYICVFLVPAANADDSSQDTLPPTINLLAPAQGLVTTNTLTIFNFYVEDPPPGTVEGKTGHRSGLDPSSVSLMVNGVDRTADGPLFKNDQVVNLS